MVLSLLGNTATLPQVLQAASTSTRADGQPAVVTVIQMLSGKKMDFRVKAATLLGNLCHDSSIRAQVFLPTGKFGGGGWSKGQLGNRRLQSQAKLCALRPDNCNNICNNMPL